MADKLPFDHSAASASLHCMVQKTRRFLWEYVPDLLLILGCTALELLIIEYFFFSLNINIQATAHKKTGVPDSGFPGSFLVTAYRLANAIRKV